MLVLSEEGRARKPTYVHRERKMWTAQLITACGGGKPTKPRTLRAEGRERRVVSNRQFISVMKCSGSVRCGSNRTHRVSASALSLYCLSNPYRRHPGAKS